MFIFLIQLFNFYNFLFFNIFNLKFLFKIIILFNLINYYNSNNIIKKCIYLYLFFFLIILMMFMFNTLDMLGFFVFVETTAILLYFIISLTFFNIFINKKNKNINFIIFFVIFNYEKIKFNFFDTRFFFLNPDINSLNGFLGIYFFLYILNVNLFFCLIIFFIIIFFIILRFVLTFKIKNISSLKNGDNFFFKYLNMTKINYFITTIFNF